MGSETSDVTCPECGEEANWLESDQPEESTWVCIPCSKALQEAP